MDIVMPKTKKFKLVESKVYSNQFYIKYPDKTLSEDFYNISRAKQHLGSLVECL